MFPRASFGPLGAMDAGFGATVSAPGKVLLAGGYLILDRPHAGTVLGLDARFYSRVELWDVPADVPSSSSAAIAIKVRSPQFRDERIYTYAPGASPPLSICPPAGGGSPPSANRYVEVPLLNGLTLLGATKGADFFEAAVARAREAGWTPAGATGLSITLQADNGFYSQVGELRARGWPLTAASLRELPRMLPPRTDEKGDFAKTGLGSSATLVTSLLGALLHAFGLIALPPRAPADAGRGKKRGRGEGGAVEADDGGASEASRSLSLLHNLSQLSHCAAQGKVGSGFDVCSATYGSHRYVRFSPAILSDLLALPADAPPPAGQLLACLGAAAAAAGAADGAGAAVWDHEVSPFQLPPGVEVAMADVCCGAHTPSMVKKVAAWRKEDGAAAELWGKYAQASRDVQAALQRLCAVYKAGAAAGVDDPSWVRGLGQCAEVDPSAWAASGEVGAALSGVRDCSIRMRALVREVSARAGVPIEPAAQTALLDHTMAQRGVLMAVVPGAGGGDAIIALLLPSSADGAVEDTRRRVGEAWTAWPSLAPRADAPDAVCELPVVESKGATEGHNGALLEPEVAAP